MSDEPDAAKAEAYFERALLASREQRAKSQELRAATSLARHLHDQGKAQQARELSYRSTGGSLKGSNARAERREGAA
jgi:hypothetical protein